MPFKGYFAIFYWIADIALVLLSANLKQLLSPDTLKMHLVVNLRPYKTSVRPAPSSQLCKISRFEMPSEVSISTTEKSIMTSKSHFSLTFSFRSCSSMHARGSGGRFI